MGWIPLYEAWTRLPALAELEAIMDVAIKSRQVDVRGMASGKNFYERIEERIRSDARVDVLHSVISDGLWGPRWFDVQVRESFVAYVEQNLLPAYISTEPAPSQRRRGPQPQKLETSKSAMRDKLRDGCLTADHLRDMREKEMKAMFACSRFICRKARNAVLSESEFVSN